MRHYYLELRLEQALRLLTQSTLPVVEVALACGFVSPSHFAKCYREQYNLVPKNTCLAPQRRTAGPSGSAAAAE